MPLELKERLDNLSKNLSKPKSSIVREALEAYLNEIEDFSFAVNALEELKDGDYSKASKKIDKIVKNLKKNLNKNFYRNFITMR
ncbi:ribbon-helix-helix domain-containing protein [Campylobacter coli]|nr:ribbon-helix-helix domain-containing protein [Campylobacter coli]EFU5996721.1 ribbon-helix-helix domain-containing protein [Campylobacter coli]